MWHANRRIRGSTILAAVTLSLLAAVAVADECQDSECIGLADAPLLIAQGAEPNFFLTVANAMVRGPHFAPLSLNAGEEFDESLRLASSDVNRFYYDPTVEYLPPKYEDTELPDAVFTRACLSPFFYFDADNPAEVDFCPANCVLDLSTHYRAPFATASSVMLPADTDGDGVVDYGPFCTWWPADKAQSVVDPQRHYEIEIGLGLDPTDVDGYCDVLRGDTGVHYPKGSSPDAYPVECQATAHYYVFDPVAGDGFVPPASTDMPCDSDLENDACYRRVWVGSEEDIALGWYDNRADAETNFANWFSFYRNPMLATQTAVSRVAAGLSEKFRFGYQNLFSPGLDQGPDDDWGSGNLNPMPFTASARSVFFEWLFKKVYPMGSAFMASESTMRIGELLQTEAPYLVDPSAAKDELAGSPTYNPLHECRRNNQLLFADGPWFDFHVLRGGPPAGAPNSSNWDGAASPPYADSNVGGFADVAYYLWANDLLPDEANNLLPLTRTRVDRDGDGDIGDNPANDPATWQHLTNYVISLGQEGFLDYQGDSFPDAIFEENAWDGADWRIDIPNKHPDPGDFQHNPTAQKVLIDDLWHGAVNSRGAYYRADNVDELFEALVEVLDAVDVTGQSGAAAAASVTSGTLSTDSNVYLASFDSADWSGELTAFRISTGESDADCGGKPRGELCGEVWSAAALLDELGAANRKIATYDPGADPPTGIAFQFDSLSAAQKDLFWEDDELDELSGDKDYTNARARLAWLRGERTNEEPDGALRLRATVLGDIVNSAILAVGPPSRRYDDATYRTFVSNNANRTETVYVGANDGMLHAFNNDTGEESFAYVPSLILDRMSELTDPDYSHQFFVDGPLTEGDALLGGGWKTVLLGALGKGGQGLYALDITDPTPADETALAGKVLWETTDRDYPDLGYIYGRPAIARIPDPTDVADCTDRDATTECTSQWVAVVPNGYNNTCNDEVDPASNCPAPEEPIANCGDPDDPDTICSISTTGNAVLYLLDLATGTALLNGKMDTGEGLNEDPEYVAGTDDPADRRPNGLGPPTVVDSDGDLVADFAYAGDLFGNIWKFDFTDLGGVGNPMRLFTAEDANGKAQPITSAIAVTRHPTGKGVQVLFGTGRFLGAADVDDASVQTFYGIWDQGAALGDASTLRTAGSLLQQTFITPDDGDLIRDVTDGDGAAVSEARLTTDYAADWSRHKGWLLDLSAETGERVVARPEARDGRVVFVTLTPSGDPCTAGGTSWVNALDVKDGSRLKLSPFDFDLDGGFDTADLLTVTVGGSETTMVGSSIRLGQGGAQGVYSAPAALASQGGATYNYVATSGGELITLRESSALDWRTWCQIR